MKLHRVLDIDLLIIRIFFFLKLNKKWLSYGGKTYAHIWARYKFLLILLITCSNVNFSRPNFTQLFCIIA